MKTNLQVINTKAHLILSHCDRLSQIASRITTNENTTCLQTKDKHNQDCLQQSKEQVKEHHSKLNKQQYVPLSAGQQVYTQDQNTKLREPGIII